MLFGEGSTALGNCNEGEAVAGTEVLAAAEEIAPGESLS